MKMANVSTIKNNLSKFLDYVKKGGTVRIMDRTTVIAEIVPMAGTGLKAPDYLNEMVAKGIVVSGRKSISKSMFTLSGKSSSGVLKALLDEREEGR